MSLHKPCNLSKYESQFSLEKESVLKPAMSTVTLQHTLLYMDSSLPFEKDGLWHYLDYTTLIHVQEFMFLITYFRL